MYETLTFQIDADADIDVSGCADAISFQITSTSLLFSQIIAK
jgi:hypothetical protein